MGIETVSHLPTLPISNEKYIMESFLNKDRLLVHDFQNRKLEISATTVNKSAGAICPEYELNYAFYNQFFTASPFIVKTSKNQPTNTYYQNSGTHFYSMNFDNSLATT
jgi:hypothetical protein